MNVWQISGPGTLQKTEPDTPQAEDGLLRVRVTKVFLSGVDAALYRGKLKARYPLVPGRFAVGFVADEPKSEAVAKVFPKGAKVLLHTFRRRPYAGAEKVDFSEDEYVVCGQTQDGFLRDFVLVSPDEALPLPNVPAENLNDERALIAHHVALGRAAIERLGVRKGQHIAVVGANVMGILICQLLIYQQAAPILIDTDPARLDFARKCGVYYTVPADEKLVENVANMTGGRLAESAIYVIGAPGNDHSIPFLVCAERAGVAFCGFVPDNASFPLDAPLKKQLTVHFVQRCSELETALNLIITHAVSTEPFTARSLRADGVKEFFDDYESHPEHDVSEINIVELI